MDSKVDQQPAPGTEAPQQSQDSVLNTIEKQGLASKEKLQAELDKFKEKNKKAGKNLNNAEETFLLKMALKINGIEAKANSGTYNALPPEQKAKVDETINQLRDILQSQSEAKAAEAEQGKKDPAFTPLDKSKWENIKDSDFSKTSEVSKATVKDLRDLGYKINLVGNKMVVSKKSEVDGKLFGINSDAYLFDKDNGNLEVTLEDILKNAKAKAKPVEAEKPSNEATKKTLEAKTDLSQPQPAASAKVETQPTAAENIPEFAKNFSPKEKAMVIELQQKGFEVRKQGEDGDRGQTLTLYRGGKLVAEASSSMSNTLALNNLLSQVPYILDPTLKAREEKTAREEYEKDAAKRKKESIARDKLEESYPNLSSLIAIEGDRGWIKDLKIDPKFETVLKNAKEKGIKLVDDNSRSNGFNVVDRTGKNLGGVRVYLNINWQKDLVVILEKSSKQEITPAGRGFTLDDIQDPKSGNKQPKFNQQPNQQDSNVNVGRIQVEGREASANQTPVKPKPNLGKVDISDIPTGEVIDPKTGKTI